MSIAPKTRKPQQPAARAAPRTGEQQFRMSAVDYATYAALGELFSDRHVRMTYADGELELMTLSHEHEEAKTLLGAFVEILVAEMDIDMHPGGFMTFQRADLERGLEPDECYWLANEARMRGRTAFDAADDPPPDLVLEVEISRSRLDRMDIYARLGVPEIWRHDGAAIRFEWLSKKGRYEAREHSRAFGFLRSADLNEALQGAAGQSRTKLLRHFRAWIQQRIADGWKP